MHNYQKYSLLVLIALVLSISMNAQVNRTQNIYPAIDIASVAGGSITSNNFQFSSGMSYQLSILKEMNEKVDLGILIGRENMDENIFYPIGLRMEASVFKNENFQAIVQAGYSLAEYISDTEVDNFDLDGGFFIDAGRQWMIPISDKLDLRSTLSFRFQFAELEYIGDDDVLEQKTDYLRVGMSIGLRLK